MNKKLATCFICLLICAISIQANARNGKAGSFKAEQIKQQNLIYKGILKGSLSAEEIARLEFQQAKIARHIKLAKRNKGAAPYEADIIKHEQLKAARSISRLTHNNVKGNLR